MPDSTFDIHRLRNALVLAALSATSLVFASLAFAQTAFAAPVNEVPPTISGEPIVGHVLTSTPGTWSEEHPPNTYQYEWRECEEKNTSSCWPVNPEDTESTYRVTGYARGEYIVLSVKTFDHEGHAGVPAYSDFIGPVVESADTAIQTNEQLGELFVKSIDNTAHTLDLNHYAALDSHAATGLQHSLSAADGSSQRYALYENNGATPVTGALATGDVLDVTSENGKAKQAYALTVEGPESACNVKGECAATFASTCSAQSFVVPKGVSELSFTLVGGAGGGAEGSGSQDVGGAGGSTGGKLAVTPGEELTVLAGGGGAGSASGVSVPGAAGGCYGGGSVGGGGEEAGAGGGGGSFLIADGRLIAAAGGGGGAANSATGGAGGHPGATGATNGDQFQLAGQGASELAASGGGIGAPGGEAGSGPATTTEPGDGGSAPYTLTYRAGGAGGGGYYGGGAGASESGWGGDGAGGGGSDYTALATPATYDADRVPGGEGDQAGDNGYVRLTWVKTNTEEPTLSAPSDEAEPEGRFKIAYSLPEAALAESVTLTFVEVAEPHAAYSYAIGASGWTSGTHEVTFDPANPLAETAISSGPASLSYGAYRLVLSYRDAAGNPAASTSPLRLTLLNPNLCHAGHYSASGETPCEEATPGNFVSTRGATTQTPCPAGTYNPEPGATSSSACLSAPAGYYAPSPSVQPVPCPAGTYNSTPDGTNASACVSVPAGYYSGQAATAPTPCPAGTESSAGASSCTAVPDPHGEESKTDAKTTESTSDAGSSAPPTSNPTSSPDGSPNRLATHTDRPRKTARPSCRVLRHGRSHRARKRVACRRTRHAKPRRR